MGWLNIPFSGSFQQTRRKKPEEAKRVHLWHFIKFCSFFDWWDNVSAQIVPFLQDKSKNGTEICYVFILSLHIILRRVSIVVETTWRINRLDTPVDVRKVTFLTKMFKTVSTFFQTLIFFIAFSSRPILMHVSCLKIHWSTQENKWRQSCFIVYFNDRTLRLQSKYYPCISWEELGRSTF